MKEHPVTTFVRTKTVFKHRLKDLKEYDTVKVYMYELAALEAERGPLLWSLKQRGEIDYDEDGNFRALKKGPVDPALLEKVKKRTKPVVPLTDLHVWMRDQLMAVSLPGVRKDDMPVYFRAFMEHRDKDVAPFFSVDAFAGRVHSPVVNLKGDLRFKVKLHGSKIISLDVKQMQPTILGKVLQDSVGDNAFSKAIDRGEDVYVMLQRCSKLPTRKDAKKYLFQLIFGKPMDDIGRMFQGNQHQWVNWINAYKSRVEEKNPHKEKMHTNLAWLLQYSEVQVMTGLWQVLREKGIPFLSIHDEILCREEDQEVVYELMRKELDKHFKEFTINVTDGSEKL